ncbi:hypothetical protein W03_17890 [Nitrosomonas sp. PY1]|nr:hypothetical protein W03_17890 [Nitrosomonas sp. PY1]
MYAEMATNYFLNANSPSLYDNLFATDAGYIPLLPRMIALLGNLLNLPASVIPYFYSSSAIILAAVMISTFCLRPFRILIQSDALRFLTAIAVTMVADFETRTFINFSYFSAFFIATITALAFVEKNREVPWWSWFIPLLILSKPAILATLPAMVITAMVSNHRFRNITIVSTVLGCLQIIQLFIDRSNHSVIFQASDNTLSLKITATIEYALGFIGKIGIGPFFRELPASTSIYIGMMLFSLMILFILWRRKASGVLALIGLSLLFFQSMINVFAMNVSWNQDLLHLQQLALNRTIILMFFGMALALSGVFALFTINVALLQRNKMTISVFLFVFWFVCSGWAAWGVKISKSPSFRAIYSSQWQHMASLIDSNVSPLCVPIDPAGWYYLRNCRQIDPDPALHPLMPITFDSLLLKQAHQSIAIQIPKNLTGSQLLALGIVVRPYDKETSYPIQADAVFTLKNGEILSLSGERQLKLSGGLITIHTNAAIPIQAIETITLQFDQPVIVGTYFSQLEQKPIIFWMGN